MARRDRPKSRADRLAFAGAGRGQDIRVIAPTVDPLLGPLQDALPDAAVMVDREGRIAVVNHLAEQVFGLPQCRLRSPLEPPRRTSVGGRAPSGPREERSALSIMTADLISSVAAAPVTIAVNEA
jgi:PAS domain-containing protein